MIKNENLLDYNSNSEMDEFCTSLRWYGAKSEHNKFIFYGLDINFQRIRKSNFLESSTVRIIKQKTSEIIVEINQEEIGSIGFKDFFKNYSYVLIYFLKNENNTHDFEKLNRKRFTRNSQFGAERYFEICQNIMYSDLEHGVLVKYE